MKTMLRLCSLLLIGLSACVNAPRAVLEAGPVGPAAWIDAPLNNSLLPLAVYEIVVHASDPGGVSAFELSVNGQLLGTIPVGPDQAADTLAHASQTWLPPGPGSYLLEVRAANTNGEYGPSAFAQVTVGGTPTPAASATPTPTPTLTPTPTEAGTWAIGLENANCRISSSLTAEVVDFLLMDQRVLIDGISPDRAFVWVQSPSTGIGHCWVLLSVIRVEGSLEGLRIILPPSTPTPTATSEHV